MAEIHLTDWVDGGGYLRSAVTPVQCAHCHRELCKVTLDSDALVVLGAILGGRGAGYVVGGRPGVDGRGRTLTGQRALARRRGVLLYDVSPGGHGRDENDSPSRYRFVCRHKSLAQRNLDQPVRVDTLRAVYERARASGEAIEVTPSGPRTIEITPWVARSTGPRG